MNEWPECRTIQAYIVARDAWVDKLKRLREEVLASEDQGIAIAQQCKEYTTMIEDYYAGRAPVTRWPL